MSWEIKILSDCCASIADGDHQAPPKADAGIPFVTIANINATNQFDFSNTMFVPQEYYDRLDSKRKAQKDDILYSVVGSFGIPVYMKDTIPFVFQRHIAILRPNNAIFPRFLYYTMLSRDFYMMADAAALGAAQRTVSLTALRNMKIAVPPLDVQKKIADVLAAYDDLIENNQKQIKLLEEAAQRLYKEWFVDLRFPGYETTPITDGVPEGWRETTVGEYLTVRSGYAFKSGWWQSEGHPVVKIKNINNNTIDMVEADYVSPERTKAIPEFKLSKGDVVIAMTGATIGKVGLIPEVDNLYTNQRVGKVFPNESIINPTPFVFCFYAQESVREKIIALSSSSSAQPNISGKQLESLEIVANTDLINLFCERTMPFFEKINSLRKQITLLAQARDRLLPKLMNGEIEVQNEHRDHTSNYRNNSSDNRNDCSDRRNYTRNN